jgi:outer membrane protein assembly factor BamE (lipoprotein component of BamABCDE complex)
MKKILLTLCTGLFFLSCTPLTPQARIQINPEKFAEFSQRDQDLIKQGQIAKGMSRDAVLFAWGNPAVKFEGFENSAATERWDYTKSKAVYSTYYSEGFGYGRYNRRGYSNVGIAIGPEFTYVPTHSASVWFRKGRVASWERAR